MTKTLAETKADAYARLEIDPRDVEKLPRISNILRAAKIKARVPEFLRGSSDPDARKWLNAYELLSKRERTCLPVEAFCLKGGVAPERLLEVLVSAAFHQTRLAGQLLALSSHADVVNATVEMAKSPDGSAERKMLLQHEEFLPMPKTQFINMPHAQIDARKQVLQTQVLPPAERMVKQLSDRFASKMIEGGHVAGADEEILDAEEEDNDE